MVNSYIINSLKSYIDNPDPRYALMLKGKWGCGKTYLVNQWIDDTFKNPEKKDDVVFEPIRVTLYGMTDTDLITKAIDRQLHPYLYTKAAKIGAGILKIAGRVVLRTDLDFNGDNKSDASLTTSLDSLSFLASKDEKIIKPGSLKLLIFDDLERSHIPMKRLLGYINYFVEYCGCHVVIVGDETKVTDKDDKKILDDFKEKTVGKEFEVVPDIDAAITQFVEELPQVDWLGEQKELIKKMFVASQCDNLRILRQCLYDFKQQYNEADTKLVKKDKSVMKTLLGSFIAVYCEYKGKNRDILKSWNGGKWAFLYGKEDTPEKKAIQEISSRYNADQFNGMNVLNDGHIFNIVTHIERGVTMKPYIDGLLMESQKVIGVLTRLEGFRDMDDDEFKADCDELSQDILTGKYRQFYSIGKALAFFSLFEKEQLYKVEANVIEKAKETLKDIFEKDVHDAELLYRCQNAFWQGMNTVENRDDEYRIHKEMVAFFNEVFKAREKDLPNKMQETLNNLNNDNAQDLIRLDDESTPDHHAPYSLTPILKDQDSTALMERIKGLKNCNVRAFALFLSGHFLLSYSLGSDFTDRFKEDCDTLRSLKELTDREVEDVCGIRKWAFQYLQKVLNGCIQRCEGKRGAMMEYM